MSSVFFICPAGASYPSLLLLSPLPLWVQQFANGLQQSPLNTLPPSLICSSHPLCSPQATETRDFSQAEIAIGGWTPIGHVSLSSSRFWYFQLSSCSSNWCIVNLITWAASGQDSRAKYACRADWLRYWGSLVWAVRLLSLLFLDLIALGGKPHRFTRVTFDSSDHASHYQNAKWGFFCLFNIQFTKILQCLDMKSSLCSVTSNNLSQEIT